MKSSFSNINKFKDNRELALYYEKKEEIKSLVVQVLPFMNYWDITVL